ncbi:MAG: PEP-utilizing enzyme, partial [Ruthenibacterium sp.]
VGIGKTNTMGYTCVCRTAEDVKTKAKHGCVLVVPSTNNEMLEAIRDAVAVIAEESGNNSHAAIVGLSLGKPVIVGAIGATRKLHDGMKVSVDGERGIVHAMPE